MISAMSLCKSYGAATVLDEVSLELRSGQALVLLGPNGAGKTTLLRILATLLRPAAGALRVAGVDALKNAPAARSVVAMVGHGSYVYEDLTAIENLRFWTTMGGHDASPARLRAALQQVELEAVADERARTFSAGMKRRLGLARVLLGRARILLLDEPFTGLDRQGTKWLSEFLLGFKDGGGSIVLATHNFGSGLGIADRVGILASGRLVLDQSRAALSVEELRRLYDTLTESDGTRS